ncbi:MAG: endonuclease/exonuclease/phosphatase family protein [Pyrinomonadaceae bacterium]|nr:endonuclease/exonuclease/phosphatase family protein [Pyrinomonadaceae bacterium]
MWAKALLAILFALMICSAFYFQPARKRSLLATKPSDGPRLRLMTWNVGYADLEDDTRAQTRDLRAVAEIIMTHDPDAIAIQELSGDEQLKILLGYLGGRYRGAVARPGNADRVEAVLVKDRAARFEDIRADGKFALGATFHLRPELPEIVLVSAHADAFSAARRRAYTGELVEWTEARPEGTIVFVAGDFNFEVAVKDESHLYTDDLKHDSEAYSYLLKYFRDLGRDAGDTAINDRRIDYIFGPPERVLLRRAEVLRGAAVGRMDHWPLLIEVAL